MHLRLGRLSCAQVSHARRSFATSTVCQVSLKQNRIPASFYRGGTSKALFFNSAHLEKLDWAPIFLRALGSPDPHARQLDGMGGGISSLSKICVVGPSSRDDADVDFTFAAVGIKGTEVDFSGACGNMTSAVGPFAVDSGIVSVSPPTPANIDSPGDEAETEVTVRIHNTNTSKLIHATFPVIFSKPTAVEASTSGNQEMEAEARASGDLQISGLSHPGASIKLSFQSPGGSKTGRLLPTGNARTTLRYPRRLLEEGHQQQQEAADEQEEVEATLIDAGNPAVFVPSTSLSSVISGPTPLTPDAMSNHATLLPILEHLRVQATMAMGLAKTEEEAPVSIPKICLVSPSAAHTLETGETINKADVDLLVRAMSVGQPHRAVPITMALAVAAAARVKGSVVHECLAPSSRDGDGSSITIGHPSGTIDVGAAFDERGNLKEATVYRTARRLMEGTLFWP